MDLDVWCQRKYIKLTTHFVIKLTNSLTYSLTDLLTGFTYSFTHSLASLLARSLIHSFTHSLIQLTQLLNILKSCHCNSFEDWVAVDFMYRYPIFKWVTVTWQGWDSARIVAQAIATRQRDTLKFGIEHEMWYIEREMYCVLTVPYLPFIWKIIVTFIELNWIKLLQKISIPISSHKVNCIFAMIFTRGQFWPVGVGVACICLSVGHWVCVCVCAFCWHHDSSPVQTRITKFGPEVKTPWFRSLLFCVTFNVKYNF